MKQQMINCFRRRLQWRSRLIFVPAAMLFFVLSAQAQTDAMLPPIGGDGGGQFIARCPQGQFLAGLELRTGNDVDAIRVICVTAYGPADVGPLVAGGESFGGNGEGLGTVQLLCPRDGPIVTAMYVRYEGADTHIVNNIHLFCGAAAINQKQTEFPAAVFDGPKASPGQPNLFKVHNPLSGEGTTRCPSGLLAVGINGRSGIWLDAVGLICGAPKLTPRAVPPPEAAPKPPLVRAIGRVTVPPPAASRPAFIYAIALDGTLQWRRYDGAAVGGGIETWQGPRVVDTGWNQFKQVFAGDNGAIYAITQQGVLRLYQHDGFSTGLGMADPGGWLPPQELGTNWGNFKEVFAGSDGVIYAIAQDGILKWYRYTGGINSKVSLEGPKDVGNGWGDFKLVFSGGEGIIYAITRDGKLQWRKYNGYKFGGGYETWEGPKDVGTGWGDFKRVFTSGDGIIYAITQNGKLMWYRHRAFKDAAPVDCNRYVGVPRDLCFKNGVPTWDGPKEVGRGWGDFLRVFAQP